MSWNAPYSAADEAVHAGVDADVAHVALLLGLRDAREEHACLRDDEAAGLQPQLEVGVRRPHLAERRVDLLEVERELPWLFRDAEASAEIEEADVREALARAAEEACGLAPAVGEPDAAARVRV